MSQKQMVKDILAAITSVRKRAHAACEADDTITFKDLMGDLYALELCLVGETEKLIKEIEAEERMAS